MVVKFDANDIEHWKRVAERYRRQRDSAVKEINRLNRQLLLQTGKAQDGNDYLREIQQSQARAPLTKKLFYWLGAWR